MAYSKQNFVNNEVLTAEMLNHIEDGVFKNSKDISSLGALLGDLSADGYGIYYSSEEISVLASNIPIDSITNHMERAIQEGDLIITANAYICQVTKINATSYRVNKLVNLETPIVSKVLAHFTDTTEVAV